MYFFKKYTAMFDQAKRSEAKIKITGPEIFYGVKAK